MNNKSERFSSDWWLKYTGISISFAEVAPKLSQPVSGIHRKLSSDEIKQVNKLLERHSNLDL